MPSSMTLAAILVCVNLLVGWAASAQKTWTGAVSDGGDWTTSGNWSPAGVPDATSDLVFDSAGALAPNMFFSHADLSAHSLSFNSGTINYTLDAKGTLSGVTAITRRSIAGAGVSTINLFNDGNASLLFPAGSSLTLTNNDGPGSAGLSTLVIGPNTVIGTSGTGGVLVTGAGVTNISGNFSSSANQVTGGLTKSGSGTLLLSGNDSGLSGTVTLAGGTLALDYGPNATPTKLGAGSSSPSGSLALSGGNLMLFSNPSNATFQSVNGTGGTVVNPGQSNISLSTSNGSWAALSLDLAAIARPAPGGTLDVNATQIGASVTTNNTVTNGILGGWFTASGGASWATKSGANIVPLTSFGTNVYSSGTNTDAPNNALINDGTFTNSLRLNGPNQVTLTIFGTFNLQSGGILVTPSSGGGTITGGTIAAPSELTVHTYKNLTINSALQATGGLTKTGPQTLTLGGDLSAVSGPVNINQGGITFTNALAIPSGASSINLNDRSGTQQTLAFNLFAGTAASTAVPIHLGANNIFSNQSSNSQITFNGPISSQAGQNSPLMLNSSNSANVFILNNSANTFTGDVSLTSGTLSISSNGNLGDLNNRLILSSGASAGGLQFLAPGLDIARPVVLSATSRVNVDTLFTDTISGPISGIGGLIKADDGTLVLSGNNTFSGLVQITAGTLQVASAANLGTGSNLTVGAGRLLATGTVNLPASRTVALNPVSSEANPTIEVVPGQTLTVAGLVTNNNGPFGTLIKTGAGTLALTGLTNDYGGGTTVQQGTLQASADGSLGGSNSPLIVNTFGTLTYTGTTTTSRAFTLNNGTLSVAATKTLTLNGSTIAGGFLSGPGTFSLAGNTMLGGVSISSSASITQTGPASIVNFSNNGQLTTGANLVLNNGINTSAGRLTVNGLLTATDFVSNGQITVNGGGTFDNSASASSLVLGGGSRTTINSGGSIKAGATSIEVNGGLLVNNGSITGTTNVHFNGEAVGTGSFGAVNVFENGRFAPGASPSPAVFSPASVAAATASFAINTSLAVEIGGANPGTGYDRLAIAGSAALDGTLDITTANSFVPAALEQFQIISASTRAGIFKRYAGITAPNGLAYAPRYTDTGLTLIATLFGDSNFDGKVDFADLVTVAQNYGTFSDTTDNWWMHGDFDLDGTVGFADLVKVAQNYGQTLPAAELPAPTQVPEPRFFGLFATVMMAHIARRRR